MGAQHEVEDAWPGHLSAAIGLGEAEGCRVVTGERLPGSPEKPEIPDLCAAWEVPCVDAGPTACRGRTSGALARGACDDHERTHAPQPSEVLSRGRRRWPWLRCVVGLRRAEFTDDRVIHSVAPCRRAACIRHPSLRGLLR